MSYGATRDEFTADKQSYSEFNRVIPNDKYEAYAIAALIAKYEWVCTNVDAHQHDRIPFPDARQLHRTTKSQSLQRQIRMEWPFLKRFTATVFCTMKPPVPAQLVVGYLVSDICSFSWCSVVAFIVGSLQFEGVADYYDFNIRNQQQFLPGRTDIDVEMDSVRIVW